MSLFFFINNERMERNMESAMNKAESCGSLVLEILNDRQEVKAREEGAQEAVMVFEGEYQKGDRIRIQTDQANAWYLIRIDDGMDEALVYLTREQLYFDIPFDEKKESYNPKSFEGARHYLTVKRAEPWRTQGIRDLALNPMDQHGDRGCYPHAWANVETRGESVFAARNAIDGVIANRSHGIWPYQSWGINRQLDAAFTLEFGRPVDMEKLVLYTRADFPHDSWWVQGTVVFSDGTREVLKMEKSEKPHVFDLEKKGITWLRLEELIQAEDPSPFPALTQIQVYGTEAKQ